MNNLEKMEKILFIGRCGFGCGVVVGGEIAKNRITYRYCKEKCRVFLIDLYYTRDNVIKYLFNKVIKKPYIVLKTVICAKLSRWIIFDSLSEPYIKIISAIGCIHKVKFIAIGGDFPEKIRESTIPASVYGSMDRIFVESYEMRDALIQMGISNAEYMPNYKYLPYYEPEDHREDKEVLKLFYLGQIRKEKGIQVLLDAVKFLNYKKIRFQVYLYGDIFDDIDIASQLNDYIFYEGKIDLLDRNDNYDILRQYDIFIFPTEWKGESLSGAVQDALALGKPIVATRHHLNDKMVFDGENGYLFEKGSIDQLVEILDRFYDNQSWITEMGNRSLKIADQFRAEIVLEGLGICAK